MTLDHTYILPIRRAQAGDIEELTRYLHWLNARADLIVVDGSPAEIFAEHGRAWLGIHHVAPAEAHRCANGKVAGVLTGLDLAQRERIVIADDDVRYDEETLEAVVGLLDEAEVVRPQNYFDPLPWHARWDSARSLLNRIAGGDWPGTLAVRRSALRSSGGYNGDCLFENLELVELVRTVRALGGRELVASDVFVMRLPPDARHFLSQRVRQAYDEFGRPGRLAWQLALLPAALLLALKQPRALAAAGVAAVALAEAGRRRGGATRVFPASTPLFAPAWLVERAVCSWLALGSRLRYGGVAYSGGVIGRAASPVADLARRHRDRQAA
jgi:hypothetical protein